MVKPKIRIKTGGDCSTPSTSKQMDVSPISTSKNSTPESPLGRVAKNNARLLNGLDINSKRIPAYADGITTHFLPDLRLSDLNFLSVLKRFQQVETTAALTPDIWHTLQHEIESLLTENLDQQKTINGEIIYLTEGEYPTVDLTNRPMPKFQLCEDPPIANNHELKSYQQLCNDSNAYSELGLLSSPEDEEDPSILDIPQRFWKWSREYLRHISENYVREFKVKLYDSFTEENIISAYCNNPATSKDTPTSKAKSKKSSSRKQDSVESSSDLYQKTKKDKSFIDQNPSPAKFPKIELSDVSSNIYDHRQSKLSTLVMEVLRRFEDEDPSFRMNGATPSPPPSFAHIIRERAHPYVGLEIEEEEAELYPKLLNGIIEKNGLIPTSTSNSKFHKRAGKNEPISPRNLEKLGIALASFGIEQGFIPPESKEIVQSLSLMDASEELPDDELMDEVASELRKKQMQLKQLYATTRPLIEELYMRIICEFAINELHEHHVEENAKLSPTKKCDILLPEHLHVML